MENTQFTAFLDESGNTGANYCDPSQPVHVLAGWIVKNSKRDKFSDVVEKAKSAMGMPELKGGRMLSTSKGRREILRVLTEVKNLAIPIFSIWEKRFCAALRVVDTFLDPEHNPRASWLPISANVQRNNTADKLLKTLPLSYFERFMEAFRTPTRETLGETCRSISQGLRIADEEKLAWSIEGCVGDILGEIVESEQSTLFLPEIGFDGLPRNVTASLNYPSFAQMIRAVDYVFEKAQSRGVIVHDETSEFALSFRRVFQLFKKIGPKQAGALEDGRSVRGGVGFVEEFLLKKSDEDLIVQAADLLSSALKGLGLAALGKIERDKIMNEIGMLLLPGLLQDQDECALWSCAATEEFKGKLMYPVIQQYL